VVLPSGPTLFQLYKTALEAPQPRRTGLGGFTWSSPVSRIIECQLSNRLCGRIAYSTGTIYIKDLLTHAEYDKGTWKE
jgi:hypothetical protein